MILLVTVLANLGVHDGLQDVLFWKNAFHVFDKSIGFINIVILEVIDNKVESGLGDHIDQGRKHLKGVLTASEDDKVVAQQISVLEHIT